MKHQDVLKLQQGGKIAIVQDKTARTQQYRLFATMAFTHLYLAATDTLPLDCEDYVLTQKILKKTSTIGKLQKRGMGLNSLNREDGGMH